MSVIEVNDLLYRLILVQTCPVCDKGPLAAASQTFDESIAKSFTATLRNFSVGGFLKSYIAVKSLTQYGTT